MAIEESACTHELYLMNDLLTTSIFAQWYEVMFKPPISVSLSQSWGVSVDEVHTQLLSWALFVVFVQGIIITVLCRRHIYALWKFVKRYWKGFAIASSIFVGSLIPDVDHFITTDFRTPYGKGYGHIIFIPLAILFVLVVTHFSRRYKTRLLGRR